MVALISVHLNRQGDESMMQPYTRLVAIVAIGALLGGCTSQQPEDPTGAEVIEVDTSTDGSATDTDDSSSSTSITDESGFTGEELDDPNSLLAERFVYFEFNKSDVRPEDRAVIGAHARYLQQNPGATMSLEGHADERGTREYNSALGERRAKAVRNLLTIQGGAGQQIRTVSWGEERPIDRGHDEVAWAANRRVEIVYVNRQ